MSCCKGQTKSRSMQKLGGWSIDPEVYSFIRETLPDNSIILELGSGLGTDVLSQHYKMHSIEHNLKFVGKYNSSYIHAPMLGKWYDRTKIEGNLPKKYDMILIDGPVGSESNYRIGFWENIDLFNTDVLMIFDDTNRPEKILFEKVLESLPGRDHLVFAKFSVILPKLEIEW